MIEIQRSADIVFVIYERFGNGFTDRFIACEMNDRIVLMRLEDFFQTVEIEDVRFEEFRTDAGDRFDPVQDMDVGIVKIIHDHCLMSGIDQFHDCMAADKPGSACN